MRALASFPSLRANDVALRQIGQTAFTLAGDIYHTPLCTRHPPAHLAVAALVVAVQLCEQELPSQWWLAFAPVDDTHLEQIAAALIVLYTRHHVAQPPPSTAPAGETPHTASVSPRRAPVTDPPDDVLRG